MKIICIGMNYGPHIREMGHDFPEKPVFFLKPDTAIIQRNRPFFLPEFSQNVQYELEMIVRICKVGKCIQPKFASTYYSEIGLGIDFTARDIQKECIAHGYPWEIAKGFDGSAPISNFVPVSNYKNIQDINFSLLLNGKEVQHGNTSQMVFSVNDIICHVSEYYTLKMGDILFTGTPQGVGQVRIGDHLQAYLEDKCLLDFYVR
ncbi:MAG: fumarylacetoacetate hydrolase family protein [Bacteroidales bacterium]|nr:fumarylacetoacetate hydrolase family protein [Bacteroidales bacterium]